ncbi:DNA mismatch repair endonuclease MutH [Thorsellia anophelis]|uniref:DNA mismatch repair protein MutH n=1 Tax=Thorsellia anophelis DSM 18579 TaxID=1123402 RepID=A0A1I0EJU4_9GAMM|nr:DNA mismatch repair endonuclease MutH [Thorsellia anophelis]SET44764.1 DNA mismatch repair protein MutH [Thorsellia anophelis DSM 18579]
MIELISPPKSLDILLARANQLAGYSLGEIADSVNVDMPLNLNKHKGWVGNFIEQLLGATAGSKAEQDFTHLNIELKTIPISHQGKPLETTFVALAPLTGNVGLTWQMSHVHNKLQQVLWIPVEGEREIPLKDRKIGTPILWSPTQAQERMLQQDWEELTELISLGQFDAINARIGVALQLRPKGANSKVRTDAFDSNGLPIKTLPLGFYLRNSFTHTIITDHVRNDSNTYL